MSDTIVLYRPVGSNELELIRRSGWRGFPPRLPEQPIFYPVVQEEYAVRIAREWNVKATGAGFVTRFEVDREYLARFEEHRAGGRRFTEYWIPAEQLEEFNRHIRGTIEVISEFHANGAHAISVEWIKVYDLAQDTETVALVQHATTTTEQFGLVVEVALFGSEDWWKAVDDGRIPTHEVTGVISRVFMSGHGDWPEFELDSSGRKTCWTRVGERAFYVEGKRAKVEYVIQKPRMRSLHNHENLVVLRIFVER